MLKKKAEGGGPKESVEVRLWIIWQFNFMFE